MRVEQRVSTACHQNLKWHILEGGTIYYLETKPTLNHVVHTPTVTGPKY